MSNIVILLVIYNFRKTLGANLHSKYPHLKMDCCNYMIISFHFISAEESISI